MITKLLVSAAVVLGSFVVVAPPAGADPNPTENHANPFTELSCGCQEVPPAVSPGLRTQLDRGLWTALADRVNHPQDR